jgi:hypothetical protein
MREHFFTAIRALLGFCSINASGWVACNGWETTGNVPSTSHAQVFRIKNILWNRVRLSMQVGWDVNGRLCEAAQRVFRDYGDEEIATLSERDSVREQAM